MLIALPKRGSSGPTNVIIRGVGPRGARAAAAGRRGARAHVPRPAPPRSWSARSIAERFEGAELGQTLRFGGRDWTVVGVFDAGGAASIRRSGATSTS